MAAFSPPRLCAAWRVEAPFSLRLPSSMGSTTLFSLLTRSVFVLDATHCSKEDSLYEGGRPCDALSCLCFSALWPQQSQSSLVQEIQSAKEIDLTCFKTFPIKAATCLQVGPMSLEWLVDPSAGFDHSRPSLFPEVSNGEQQRGALPASTRSRWKQNALQPLQVLQVIAGWDGCGPFLAGGLRCITWNTSVSLDQFFLSRKTDNSNSNYLKNLFDNNILCLHLQHLDQRGSLMLFPGNLLGPRVLHPSGKELRHRCLLYGHGPDATSSIHDNSVPFLNAWNCGFPKMKSCAAAKILSPQDQIITPRGSR